VVVFALDALGAVVRDSLAQRLREAEHAERIIQDETSEFDTWLRGRAAVPLVRELHAHFERVRAEELNRCLRHFRPEEKDQLEQLTRSLVQKLLLAPTVHLKAVDLEATTGLCWAEAVRGLFAINAPSGAEAVRSGR
jgi:glutamyl-tRNA reductase